MLKPNFSKQREKKSQKRERERIRIRRCVRLPERSRRVSTRSIERSNDKDNYAQVSSSSRAIRREEEERKKEKTTSLLLFYAKVVDEKKRRFAESLAKVFDTKTTRCTHPNLLPRSFCCGAVRIEFVHLVVRAFHLVLFFVQRLFFFCRSHVKKRIFQKGKERGGIYINTKTHARNSFSSLEKRNTRGLEKRAGSTERKRVRSLRQRRRTNKEL